MFNLPGILGAPRYFSESSGVMPLNALNGSSQTCNDESLTSCGLPSYEEAVTNGSMFGLFNVNGGEDIHDHHQQHHHHHHHHHPHHPHNPHHPSPSPKHQQQSYNDNRGPPLYHSLLTPTGSDASVGKAANHHSPCGSRAFDAAERLDLSSESSDSHGTRLSRISVVSSLSVQRTPSALSPKVQPRNSENKMTSADNGKATGNGSGSRRKYLTVDRSALASARDRLYRVFSPVLTRKTDHQSSKKDGSDCKKNPGDKKGAKEETTSHPVRMRLSPGRHHGTDSDRFDDIRSAGKRSGGHKHHQHRHNDSK